MRLILVLVLLLVGILETPLSYDFKSSDMPADSLPPPHPSLPFSNLASVSSPSSPSPESSPTPRPSSAPLSSSSPESSPTPKPSFASKFSPSPKPSPTPSPKIVKEIILLNKKTKLKNEALKLNFPDLEKSQNWLLFIEYTLISMEDMLGFDDPGFTVYVDDQLAYQKSAFETGTKTIGFDPTIFNHQAQTLTIWSGNSGDGLKDTSAIIKNIKLIPQNSYNFVETESINDLTITIDNKDFFTLQWNSPKTNDFNLDRVLAYDIRYFHNSLTEDNWSESQKIEIILPEQFSPHKPKDGELILIKAPPIDSNYIAIRSINSSGQLSSLGESVLFANSN